MTLNNNHPLTLTDYCVLFPLFFLKFLFVPCLWKMKGALMVYYNKHFTIMLASVLLCKSKKIDHVLRWCNSLFSGTTVQNNIRDNSWKYPYLRKTEGVQSDRVKKKTNKNKKKQTKITKNKQSKKTKNKKQHHNNTDNKIR